MLTAIRADGTSTCHTIGPADAFGPVHDLAHYVMESLCGIRRGFLGLLAEGWNIDDFEAVPASRIPAEAIRAERLAGGLSRQRLMGQPLSAVDFNWAAQSPPGEELTAGEVEDAHRWLGELWGQWKNVPPGQALELQFPPAGLPQQSDKLEE